MSILVDPFYNIKTRSGKQARRKIATTLRNELTGKGWARKSNRHRFVESTMVRFFDDAGLERGEPYGLKMIYHASCSHGTTACAACVVGVPSRRMVPVFD